ncbi:MAG TPA: class I SAM-dependent methyltransferase [Acidimicrobiia bacterium]
MTDFFDARAGTWDDDPAKVERARVVARAIRDSVPLDATVRMLEYGAGTGLVTQALRGAVGPVTLADTSAGMREVVERKIASGELEDARVWDLDLATQEPPPDAEFDLIVTVQTLHHIRDLGPVLARFARLLRDGGHLCIADLESEDGSFHGSDFAGHRGFARAELEADLVHAGFADVTYERCAEVVRGGVAYPLFLATCVRPAAGGTT